MVPFTTSVLLHIIRLQHIALIFKRLCKVLIQTTPHPTTVCTWIQGLASIDIMKFCIVKILCCVLSEKNSYTIELIEHCYCVLELLCVILYLHCSWLCLLFSCIFLILFLPFFQVFVGSASEGVLFPGDRVVSINHQVWHHCLLWQIFLGFLIFNKFQRFLIIFVDLSRDDLGCW